MPRDVKNLISVNPSASFVHVSRMCNEAAHLLAKMSAQFNGVTWLYEPPEIIHKS
jgi:hypothetical protein